jgi:TolB-like protein/Tfp pilus assembly protein PilF
MPLPGDADGPGAIAVMPFDSVTGDPNDAYLGDGIACEIISALGRAGYRRIAPRADCFALRGRSLSIAEIAKHLSVRYVVHGSVRQSGGRLRFIAEFADSGTGRQLWSKTYNREPADLLEVQEEIAQAIAASLGGETFRAEVINLSPGTVSKTAWGLVQQARHEYLTSIGPSSIQKALKLARQALGSDPNYALAHALVGQLQIDLVSIAAAADPQRSRAEARQAIEQALAMAGRDPEILMFAGRVWVELGEREKSISALRRGTELAPHDMMAWGWLARSLAFGDQSQAAEACAITRRIIEIAPEHPNAWTWQLFQGLACMNLERYPDALTAINAAVETSPKFARGLMALACAYGACDQAERAAETVTRALAVNPAQKPDAFVSYVQTLSGSREATERITRGLLKSGLLAA